MSIGKILVPLTGEKSDEVSLAAAFLAANVFGAHVQAMFVYPDPREAIPYGEMPLSPRIVDEILEFAAAARKSAWDAAGRSFAAATSKSGIGVKGADPNRKMVTAALHEATGHPTRVIENASILSDLVVFPPISEADGSPLHDAFVAVLTNVGRPVLLAPASAPQHMGGAVAVGWDGGRAAANALVSSIPFLERAETVEILQVNGGQAGGHSLEDACAYLAFHNIRCNKRVVGRDDRSIDLALLEMAERYGCDLLVVGGYGHSRFMESIFGGVTQGLTSNPAMPILMIH